MNATVEQALISKLRTLSPQQVAEVEDFVEFLAGKARKRAAWDRLLAIAPALEAAGVAPMTASRLVAEGRVSTSASSSSSAGLVKSRASPRCRIASSKRCGVPRHNSADSTTLVSRTIRTRTLRLFPCPAFRPSGLHLGRDLLFRHRRHAGRFQRRRDG